MNFDQIPNRADGIVWRIVDEGVVLVSPESGEIRVLNELGTAIWQLLDGERSAADLEFELQKAYDVPAARLRGDLRHFLEELSRRDLLTWRPPADASAGE